MRKQKTEKQNKPPKNTFFSLHKIQNIWNLSLLDRFQKCNRASQKCVINKNWKTI